MAPQREAADNETQVRTLKRPRDILSGPPPAPRFNPSANQPPDMAASLATLTSPAKQTPTQWLAEHLVSPAAIAAAEKAQLTCALHVALERFLSSPCASGVAWTWMANEAALSVLQNRFQQFAHCTRILEALPLQADHLGFSFPRSLTRYTLAFASQATARNAPRTLRLTGAQLSNLLAEPCGFFVLWQAMLRWPELAPLALGYHQLQCAAGQPDGDEAIAMLSEVWQPLVEVGFTHSMLRDIVAAPLARRKLYLAQATKSHFAAGTISPGDFVSAACRENLGIRAFEHLVTSEIYPQPQALNPARVEF